MDYITRIPADLRPGDIVACHGMRCLVTDAPVLSKSHPGGRTFVADTLVLNRDDVPREVVPYGFTSRPDGTHRWTVQGNDLARVSVEVGTHCAKCGGHRTLPDVLLCAACWNAAIAEATR